MIRTGNLQTLQAARAIACLLVVLYHALQAAGGDAAIRAWPNGSAGVDLFFVISGAVMVLSTRSLATRPDAARTFCIRRLRRIVPLYWLLTTAKLALATATPTLTPHTTPNAWNIAASLLFIPSRDTTGAIRPVLPIGWTLNVEMLFYALFAAALARRASPLWITPILAALALAGFWRTPSWPAPLSLANGMVLEFAAGMALATWHLRPPLPRPFRPPLWLAPVAAIALLTLPACGPWRFLAWGVPATLLIAIATTHEHHLAPHLPRLLLTLGDASFATYLIHPFIIAALTHAGPPGALAAIPASLAAGLAVHRFIDAPLQRTPQLIPTG
jgi:peptidoglycan/LPS O-acetylase OafA/YrhL